MSPLTARGRRVRSVFDLLGTKEPDLTAAVGFTLASSDALAQAFLDDLGIDGSVGSVSIEAHGDATLDRTDIELVGDDTHVIIEAKRGWMIPTTAQLRTYALRAPTVIVVVTDCTDAYARQLGLPEAVDDVRVVHRSWRHVIDLVRSVTGPGRRWERELLRYLEAKVATMQDVESNQVYCVSLGPLVALGGVHGKAYVNEDVYFHPHTPGWPHHPPTYLGFRYEGRLRTIRHVDEYEVVADLRDAVKIAEVTSDEAVARPHLVYRLGPHIGPPEPVPYGTNFRAARHWIFLDLLLTSETYKDALEASAQRRASAGLT